MIHLLLHFAVLTGTVLLLAKLMPGVKINNTRGAATVAVVFGGLNLLVGWLVTLALKALLFIPAFLTFGLAFIFVPLLANALLLWITDKLLDAFELRDGKALFVSAALITAANAALHVVLR
jgi:putative membrane protein